MGLLSDMQGWLTEWFRFVFLLHQAHLKLLALKASTIQIYVIDIPKYSRY